jgi:hypothetical protein
MNFQTYSELIETALATLGLNPVETRCADEGQWMIFNGETEIYIDLWENEKDNPWLYFESNEPLFMFQIIAPICLMPEDKSEVFYEEILHNNLNMLYGSYTINKEQNMLAVKYRRPVTNISQEEIIDLIECIGYYAESTFDILKERYPIQKIAQEN